MEWRSVLPRSGTPSIFRLNGKNLAPLTPANGNHEISWATSGKDFVDSYSQPDVLPVAELPDENGKLITTLERTGMSKLLSTGWKPR